MRKEWETYLRVKEYMKQNDYDESDVTDRFKNKKHSEIKLRVWSEGNDWVEYESTKDASKEIRVSRETLLYAYHNRRPLITRRKGELKVFILSGFDSCIKHHSK